MPELIDKQEQLCDESRWDFSDLSAVYLNCTLKRSPERWSPSVIATLTGLR